MTGVQAANDAAVTTEMSEILQIAAQLAQDTSDIVVASPISTSGGNTTMPTSEDDCSDSDDADDMDDVDNCVGGGSSKHNKSSANKSEHNNSTRHPKDGSKLKHHNILERKRRDLIKESFAQLRDAVPTLANERASRTQILKKAADFIQQVHRRNESVRASIEELERKNRELEMKSTNDNGSSVVVAIAAAAAADINSDTTPNNT